MSSQDPQNLPVVSTTQTGCDGYDARSYADALNQGALVAMPRSEGYLIKRKLPDFLASAESDLVSPYPVYACKNWDGLADDIRLLNQDYVTLSLVTDPFFDCSVEYLKETFPDKCIKFKPHYIIDTSLDLDCNISSHHRRNVRRSLKSVSIDVLDDPYEVIDEWMRLYSNLIERHRIQGVAQFSDASFRKQLRLPGMIATVARFQCDVVGIALWLLAGNIGYYHLAAYSDRGYELNSSFAIFYESLKYLSARTDYVSLGGGAGAKIQENDGLARFKQGWASESRDVYFCGKVLDRDKYQSICGGSSKIHDSFFPAYRAADY